MAGQAGIEQHLERCRALGSQVCEEIQKAMTKIGFADGEIEALPEFDTAQFSLIKDPYTMVENLTGFWYDARQQRIGNIQFLSDGSFYAEFDVVKPHPTKNQWFVEAINAWGKPGQIKTEAKLLPALE